MQGNGIPDWMRVTAEPAAQSRNGMWIVIDGAPHKEYVEVGKLCRLRVTYVTYGNYKVVGQLGDADLCLKGKFPTEAEAEEWLDELVRNAMS